MWGGGGAGGGGEVEAAVWGGSRSGEGGAGGEKAEEATMQVGGGRKKWTMQVGGGMKRMMQVGGTVTQEAGDWIRKRQGGEQEGLTKELRREVPKHLRRERPTGVPVEVHAFCNIPVYLCVFASCTCARKCVGVSCGQHPTWGQGGREKESGGGKG
jgi:hypothetical protein